MGEQTRVAKPVAPRRREDGKDTPPPAAESAVVEKGKKISDNIDVLAEEIDRVLQDNVEKRTSMDELIDEIDAELEACAFQAKGYVQRGGE